MQTTSRFGNPPLVVAQPVGVAWLSNPRLRLGVGSSPATTVAASAAR